MRCYAELARAAVLFAAALLSFMPARTAAQDGMGFAARVAEAVAARWGVPAADVRVALASDRSSWPNDSAGFRLLGTASDGRWTLAVEGDSAVIRLLVRAGIELVQPVAARDLARGETLQADDITLRPALVWGPPQKEDARAAAGWTTRRRLTRGELLRAPAVAPPLAIRPGDEVRIVYVRDGISIALAGRAAGQAGIGERIAVRTQTGKRLEGIAEAAGVVRIASPGRDHS
jgi:flagella basal body P-ring formation protein FlgA